MGSAGGYLAVFLIGLLGGVHCFGMCGGIVGALTLQTEAQQGSLGRVALQVTYNLARISTYTVMGAILGGLGAIVTVLESVLPVQLTLYVVANLLLVAMGLYLLGQTQWLAPVERLGQRLWVRVQPLSRRLLPVRSLPQAALLGGLWGFLPCGLVYSVLATALMSGSALRGALLMVAFGLGTLPNLLLAGLMFHRFRRWVQHAWVRWGAGVVVILFGLWGLWRAPELGWAIWQGVVCHTP
jgi:sulfite exporter TauE/SafE